MTTDKYFYSILKNEDATPYVGKNVIIVADGLGGAGSTVHEIPPIEQCSLRDELLGSAFYDFYFEKEVPLKTRLEEWIAPMADGAADTSALWASRIVIARCAYALEYICVNCDLSDEAVRQNLVEYIWRGLKNTATYFSLKKGRYDNQMLLPTTLAFMRYGTDENGNTNVEVVWAGDSRCYLLNKDGLKQLSVDDEDESGAITNLFFVKSTGEITTKLNYRKYMVKGPCVLIGASDGIFDPFEPHGNFGVEKTLLEHIAAAQSYEELMQNLCEFYGKVHSDDATMAFVPIGFESYENLKTELSERAEFISDMWQKFCDLSTAIEIVHQPEEELSGYVESRTRDKFVSIMSMLLANYKEHGDNWIYSQEMRSVLAEACAQERKRQTSSRIQKSLYDLRNDIIVKKMYKSSEIFNSDLNIPDDIRLLIENAKTCYNSLKSAENRKAVSEKTSEERVKLRRVIFEKEEYYWQKFFDLRYDDLKIKERERIAMALRLWISIDTQFQKNNGLMNINKLTDSHDKKLAQRIDKFIRDNKDIKRVQAGETERTIEEMKGHYVEVIEQLFDMLVKYPSVCAVIFNQDIVKRYGLASAVTDDKAKNDKEYEKIDVSRLDKEKITSIIVKALAQNYGSESMIDSFYNATKLNAFKYYYELKANPNNEIAVFEGALNELEAEYERLIAE